MSKYIPLALASLLVATAPEGKPQQQWNYLSTGLYQKLQRCKN